MDVLFRFSEEDEVWETIFQIFAYNIFVWLQVISRMKQPPQWQGNAL